ncbi:MAG TPA: ACT domain-containing protein [Gemmatimonadaceae bacterium]|jgi:acetolactate synthase small subunit|nr:ACT domain-containing protein [Gemmatimonadaceae bacterium]
MINPLTIVALVHTTPTAVYRILSVCRRYRAQMESITVARTEREDVCRITLVVHGAPTNPLVAQLRKLVDVTQVETAEGTVQRSENHRSQPMSQTVPISNTRFPPHSAQADGDFSDANAVL